MRYAFRKDDNESVIVKALRNAGAYVYQLHVPCDLLVGYTNPKSGNKYSLLLEVKDGKKPPSDRKLTKAEQEFFNEWTGGLLAIVESVDDALAILKKCE